MGVRGLLLFSYFSCSCSFLNSIELFTYFVCIVTLLHSFLQQINDVRTRLVGRWIWSFSTINHLGHVRSYMVNTNGKCRGKQRHLNTILHVPLPSYVGIGRNSQCDTSKSKWGLPTIKVWSMVTTRYDGIVCLCGRCSPVQRQLLEYFNTNGKQMGRQFNRKPFPITSSGIDNYKRSGVPIG